MFDLSTGHFQITWTLAAILVLAAAAAWRAASNWNVVRWRSIVLGVVAVLLLLFALNSMFTRSSSSSSSGSSSPRTRGTATDNVGDRTSGIARLSSPITLASWEVQLRGRGVGRLVQAASTRSRNSFTVSMKKVRSSWNGVCELSSKMTSSEPAMPA